MLLAILSLILSSAYAEPMRVAVIDTGLDLTDLRFSDVLCPSGHKDFTGTGLNDNHGHGTHVTGLIAKNAESLGYCLVVLKFFDPKMSPKDGSYPLLQALRYAAYDLRVKIVNLSGGDQGFSESEYLTILEAPKTTFIVAAGNDNRDVAQDRYSPAMYHLPNMVVVGSLKTDRTKAPTSNFGPLVDAWEVGEAVSSTLPGGLRLGEMSGTSQATAVHTGKVIKALMKKTCQGSKSCPVLPSHR